MTHRLRTIVSALCLALVFTGCQTSNHDLGPSHTVAGATGGQALASGVPVGSWHCRFVSSNAVSINTINTIVQITADGRGQTMSGFDFAYRPGYSFGFGKFAGRKRINWGSMTTYTKVSRVGDEVYCYRAGSSPARLTVGNPPGYTLRDYESFGGGLQGAAFEAVHGKENAAGFDLYRIQGKDLVLQNSTDGRRWLFKKGSSH